MPTTGNAAAQGKVKFLITALLLVGLMVGLAACRGFFGQAPIALLVVTAPTDDQEVPVTVTFDISASNDPDGTIATYDLDFGDESTHATGTDVSTAITHEYTVARTYTVTLTITDNDGRTGMDTGTVTIGPVMLTFASNRSDYDIWRMQADGTNLTKVLETNKDELFPDLVRGTRGKIAYAAEDGTSWDIWTMTVTGTNNAQLTTEIQTPSNKIQPSWSHDGSKIAYAANTQTSSTTTWEIYTMTATGASQTPLTYQTPSWAIAPAYSPVTNNVAFVSDKDADGGGTSIWIQVGAANKYKLYDSAGSHDGDASPTGFLSALQTALSLPFGAGISKPAWSPDGKKIAFSSDMAGGTGGIDVWIITVNESVTPPTASDLQNLNTFSGGTPNTTDDEFCPYWLEDGSGLAFVREVGGAYHIYKVSFSDGSLTTLTSTGTNLTPAAPAAPAARR